MTATIETVDQFDELPVGTIIARHDTDIESVTVAVKTSERVWESVHDGQVFRGERDVWVGADILVRKVDYLALAQHVDDCRKQLTAAQNRCDAAEQDADSAWARVGELEDELDELRRELAAAKQVAA